MSLDHVQIIEEIQENIQGRNTIIQHIFRKGNKLANYLPNHAINLENCKYEHF